MSIIAFLIGIYSYIIFALGLMGLLNKEYILSLTILYLVITIFLNRLILSTSLGKMMHVFTYIRQSKLTFIICALIIVQSLVNLIGVLGPELGFDALWYHLTLPKLYLINHSVFHIPGNLLYYSDMPKLTEMLYIAGLTFGDEMLPKLIHFSFGILSLVALYKLSCKFLSKTNSLLVVLLFYSNLVVGWMSITAYIDLARTFLELMTLWLFLEWFEKRESKWLIASAIMLGLAISTKLLALGSLFIFIMLIIIFARKFINVLIYLFFALIVPLPWFIFSYINTGNPLYPFFTDIYPIKFNFNFANPLNLADPISPLYVIFLPLAVFFYKKFKPPLKLISSYCFLATLVWYLTPQTGGGRFILPYLPAFSVLSIWVVNEIRIIKTRAIIIGAIVLFSLFSLIYRFGANLKYIPVVFGHESKAQFLSKNLNFSFGDFYDVDGYFKNNIKQTDKVLLYGFHNLYYVNFPFIDSSWVKKGDRFNFIAVLGNNLPDRFSSWSMIYYNQKTNVKLYSIGGLEWTY